MRKAAAANHDLNGNVPDKCPLALVLVDVLNDLDFPGAAPLLRIAEHLAKNIAALKRRCHKAGIPAIYVNDNRGRWRSDYPSLMNHCLRDDAPGRALVEPLIPLASDYIVLKPKHSAFYASPLDTLLAYLQSQTIVLVGLTTDACVLTTACEIHIRDLNLYVPHDCVAAIDKRHHNMAMQLMRKSFAAHTTTSRRLDLQKLIDPGNRRSRQSSPRLEHFPGRSFRSSGRQP